jgi:hypothetical protein
MSFFGKAQRVSRTEWNAQQKQVEAFVIAGKKLEARAARAEGILADRLRETDSNAAMEIAELRKRRDG